MLIEERLAVVSAIALIAGGALYIRLSLSGTPSPER